jgi:hypothetical protein
VRRHRSGERDCTADATIPDGHDAHPRTRDLSRDQLRHCYASDR